MSGRRYQPPMRKPAPAAPRLEVGTRVRLHSGHGYGTITRVRFDGDAPERVELVWDTGQRATWDGRSLVVVQAT
jgi:hypothetical protein